MHHARVIYRRPTAPIEPDVDRSQAFALLADIERMPENTDTVLGVDVYPADSTQRGSQTSCWRVQFGRGVLHWIERDEIDEIGRVIRFTLVEGDLAQFTGSWQVTGDASETSAIFDATFDMGMPELDEALSPIAAGALIETVEDILRAVLGPQSERVHAAHAPLAVAS
jgi:Polyketide cyclase / dehydrase and lipid transport